MGTVRTRFALTICAVLSVAAPAVAQNTAPTATPATQNSAPAALRPANPAITNQGSQAPGSPARNATVRNAQRGVTAAGKSNPATADANGASGSGSTNTVTGVPRYRAGFRGPRGTVAPDATASITVPGEAASPVGTSAEADPTASSDLQSLPKLPGIQLTHNSLGIRSGTPIHVKLAQPVDSGHAKNGQMISGTLAAPLGSAPAGAPVKLTVVAAAAAGTMSSSGELSLQVISINGDPVLSDVITAEGKEGAKITADAAPERGTEAIFTPDEAITLPAS